MTRPSYAFTSDNASPAHPRVLQALIEANKGYQRPYCNDDYSLLAAQAFKKHFGPEVEVFFTMNGTGANVVSLLSTLNSYQGVLCTADAHITTDECGAAERIAGCKLITIPSYQGKITLPGLDAFLSHQGDLHRVQLKILSLTQATELGTVYSLEEIKTLCDWAHDNNLLVHMDGARLSNAVASLSSTFKASTLDVGVDILSFGATKNGLAFGEAIVVKKQLAEHFPFIRKQCTQLLSKGRYLSAQFLPYFEEEIWKTNAMLANTAAKKIAAGLKALNIHPLYPVDANEIFIELEEAHLKRIQPVFFIYPWTKLPNQKVIARLVTNWANTEEEITTLLTTIAARR